MAGNPRTNNAVIEKEWQRERMFLFRYTLLKKKIKFSSYIRKFRRDQLQSHIWLTASSYKIKHLRISSWKPYPMTLQLLPSEFPYIWGKFCFLFISVCTCRMAVACLRRPSASSAISLALPFPTSPDSAPPAADNFLGFRFGTHLYFIFKRSYNAS